MITDTFDNASPAIINPQANDDAPAVDACILTFSHAIEKFVREHYDCTQIGSFWFATGETPVWQIEYAGRKFAFYKTYVGAPACVGSVEDTLSVIRTKKYIVFGGAGCLNKEIAHGKVMIPTEGYRDEGTSYHYAPPSDYIAIRNADTVAKCMAENGIPYVKGKTWTTDSFYRETVNNFEKRLHLGGDGVRGAAGHVRFPGTGAVHVLHQRRFAGRSRVGCQTQGRGRSGHPARHRAFRHCSGAGPVCHLWAGKVKSKRQELFGSLPFLSDSMATKVQQNIGCEG